MPVEHRPEDKRLTIIVTPETHKLLGHVAVEKNQSLQKVAETCLNDCAKRQAAELGLKL
jgi:predicted HicB family RNase H-like nuclease